MKKNFKNNTKRMSLSNLAVIVICSVLAASALLAGVGFLSKGFTNTDVQSWFERELNEDNLIKKADYDENIADELDNGLKLEVKDSGEIVLRGKVDDKTINGEQDPEPYAFTSITVDGGKVYTLSTGNKNCSLSTFGLVVVYVDANGESQSVRVGSDPYVIDLTGKTEQTTFTLKIFYENDVTYFGINSYIRPVLVEGDTAGEFYK